jgi:hypothetical protein
MFDGVWIYLGSRDKRQKFPLTWIERMTAEPMN